MGRGFATRVLDQPGRTVIMVAADRPASADGHCLPGGRCATAARASKRKPPPPTPGAHGARAAARGQLLVNWVFFQVSVAILLDNFLAASNALKMEKELRVIQRKQTRKQLKNPLDPLLLRLSKDYTNEADLSKRLRELFKVGRGSARGPQADGGGRLFSGAPLRSCLMQGLPVVRVYRAAGRAVCP